MIMVSAAATRVITTEAPTSADGRETGGILIGHDHGRRIIVTTAGDPGPNAQRLPHRFVRDLEHARHLADAAYEQDASVWIGEWHTHPGGPGHPSELDMATYQQLLADPDLGFARIVSLIALPCPAHGWSETLITGWVVTPQSAHPAELNPD